MSITIASQDGPIGTITLANGKLVGSTAMLRADGRPESEVGPRVRRLRSGSWRR